MPTGAVVQKKTDAASTERSFDAVKHAVTTVFLEEQSGSRAAAKIGTLQNLKRIISAEATNRSFNTLRRVFGRKHWRTLHHGSRRRARNMKGYSIRVKSQIF
jgi:hypothetical protein